jgi:hypothetical protein
MIKNPEDDFIVLEQVVNAIIPAIWIHTFSIIIVGGLYYHTYQKIVSDSLRHIAYFIWMMVLGVITLNIGLIFVSIISLVQNYQNETK